MMKKINLSTGENIILIKINTKIQNATKSVPFQFKMIKKLNKKIVEFSINLYVLYYVLFIFIII